MPGIRADRTSSSPLPPLVQRVSRCRYVDRKCGRGGRSVAPQVLPHVEEHRLAALVADSRPAGGGGEDMYEVHTSYLHMHGTAQHSRKPSACLCDKALKALKEYPLPYKSIPRSCPDFNTTCLKTTRKMSHEFSSLPQPRCISTPKLHTLTPTSVYLCHNHQGGFPTQLVQVW